MVTKTMYSTPTDIIAKSPPLQSTKHRSPIILIVQLDTHNSQQLAGKGQSLLLQLCEYVFLMHRHRESLLLNATPRSKCQPYKTNYVLDSYHTTNC